MDFYPRKYDIQVLMLYIHMWQMKTLCLYGGVDVVSELRTTFFLGDGL